MKSKLVGLLAVGLSAAPIAANSVTIVFDDEATFQAATGATLANLPTPAEAPGTQVVPQSGFLQIGPTLELDVTSGVTGGRWDIFDQSHWVSCTGGQHCLQGLADTIGDPILGISDFERFDIRSFDRTAGGPTPPLNPLYAFGFNIYEPINDALGGFSARLLCSIDNTFGCAQSTYKIALQNGNVGVAAFDFAPSDDNWGFWGVQSTVAFNVIRVSEITGGIENEYFSRFFYATSFMTPELPEPPTGSVPEPGSLSLVGFGLLILLARRRPIIPT
ncbi:MAG TPA: PEP-CTERM sorting domain-containing protein [Gammaproteobacteria bacterium]|nr:PEP-CTERM sorting domain-containing protein [Gammaproteobacteria bacterium]